jgi:hypothetical protein
MWPVHFVQSEANVCVTASGPHAVPHSNQWQQSHPCRTAGRQTHHHWHQGQNGQIATGSDSFIPIYTGCGFTFVCCIIL